MDLWNSMYPRCSASNRSYSGKYGFIDLPLARQCFQLVHDLPLESASGILVDLVIYWSLQMCTHLLFILVCIHHYCGIALICLPDQHTFLLLKRLQSSPLFFCYVCFKRLGTLEDAAYLSSQLTCFSVRYLRCSIFYCCSNLHVWDLPGGGGKIETEPQYTFLLSCQLISREIYNPSRSVNPCAVFDSSSGRLPQSLEFPDMPLFCFLEGLLRGS